MQKLLIIDDERNVRYSLTQVLSADSVQIVTAETGQAGIAAVKREVPDAVLLDVRLPDMSGLDALAEILAIDARLPVVIITAHGTSETAIEATKRGAFDYLLKPFDLPHLRGVVARTLEASRMARVPALIEESTGPVTRKADLIVGRCPSMQEVYKAIGRAASSDVQVLLLGESGTGKELVARAIYQHSRRHDRPFLAINCAAIPENLLESELFGHERGAFTGAERRRIGRFEQAHGGTIFLDEIGDMSPATQAKVLRLLQDQRFERVGGNETLSVDVRVVAATNQDLEKLVAEGRFRGDLYYRLYVYVISLPPLRERLDDLPRLVEHFLRLAGDELGKTVRVVPPDTWELLKGYRWAGNVRELQSAIRSAVINSTGDVLLPDCMPSSVRGGGGRDSQFGAQDTGKLDVLQLVRQLLRSGEEDIYRKVEQQVDRVVLREVMRACDDNQVESSRRLGISRTTLRGKLQSLGPAEESPKPDPTPPGNAADARFEAGS